MNLTQTASLTKKGLVAFVFFVLLGITFFVGYRLYYVYYVTPRIPVIQEKPTIKFGILPKPNIEQSSGSANLKYTLDTSTGALPTFPKLVKVYFVPQLGTTLLAPEKVQALANSLGFTDGPDIQNITQYHFQDPNGGRLIIDLNSGNFKFDRPATQSASLSQARIDNQDKLISDFKDYLSGKSLLQSALTNGRGSVTYNAPTQDAATSAFVTIWPSDLDSMPILTPKFNAGLITAVSTKSSTEIYKYITVDYTFWTPDSSSASTYPLKTGDQALADLKAGRTFIALPQVKQPISITKVYLAYLETDSYSPYIQPIYVFEGPNFAAYVPAIDPNYLAK